MCSAWCSRAPSSPITQESTVRRIFQCSIDIMESSRGIQQLMEAEQTATKIVAEMREGKLPRGMQLRTWTRGAAFASTIVLLVYGNGKLHRLRCRTRNGGAIPAAVPLPAAKVERMKQAKTEAATVVEKYKKDKEAEFAAKTRSSSLAGDTATLQKSTDADIAQMKVDFEANKAVSTAHRSEAFDSDEEAGRGGLSGVRRVARCTHLFRPAHFMRFLLPRRKVPRVVPVTGRQLPHPCWRPFSILFLFAGCDGNDPQARHHCEDNHWLKSCEP